MKLFIDNLIFVCLGDPCFYNACHHGGTCYHTGRGKDTETHCICPSITDGGRCEQVKKSEKKILKEHISLLFD